MWYFLTGRSGLSALHKQDLLHSMPGDEQLSQFFHLLGISFILFYFNLVSFDVLDFHFIFPFPYYYFWAHNVLDLHLHVK